MRVKFKPWAKPFIEENPEIFINIDTVTYEGIFPNDNPIHLEIGMGKGQFLFQLAKNNPDINYIGIELQSSVIVIAGQKLLEEKLPNVKLCNIDIAKIASNASFKNKIEKIYLNFSDPWPKSRHSKRRLTSHIFLPLYEQLLTTTGDLEFKTDNQGLYEYSLVSLSEQKWTLKAVCLDVHNSDMDNIKTEYEEKFSQKGFTIKYLKAYKEKNE